MKSQVYEALLEKLDDANIFLEGELDAAEAMPRAAMQVEVAFEELFVNVCHYAYPDGSGDVRVDIDIEAYEDGNVLTVTLSDSGIPFDPLAMEDPDVSLKAEDRSIGGLGVYMVKKTMDEVTYKYEDGKNIISFKKKVS